MYKSKLLIVLACIFILANISEAKEGPRRSNSNSGNSSGNVTNQASLRSDCSTGVQTIQQGMRRIGNQVIRINNVRATLALNGDVWWNGSDGKYVVPNVPVGEDEVSSIFSGSVWLGGYDEGDNLKLAAKTYGFTNTTDFWPGPLREDDPETEFDETGTTTAQICADWSKFFEVYADEIDLHLANLQRAENDPSFDYPVDSIPENILGWPASGNVYFEEIHGFDVPDSEAGRGMGSFWDQDGDGAYEPEDGDFPVIEIRGCNEKPQYPDQMIFWVYNDAGNAHTESEGNQIQMEVQVQAFSYQTNDEINDMTFQRYKLINRATGLIKETFFAMWVDPDLGCSSDDYIGCDTSRSMAYVYNMDALDGSTGCSCDGGVNTYCDHVPILGVDYFRGPLNENGDEIGMSSFTYYNNGGQGGHDPNTTDPNTANDYYNYLSGKWRNGTPFTYGGTGYNPASTNYINYAYTDDPDSDGWSMCSPAAPEGDRRTVQASGPFTLEPGAINELIIGVVWMPDIPHPCPNIEPLKFADDVAQSLFDNCFELTDGPDAPDLDWLEMDQEAICIISNDELLSNNYNESYEAIDFRAPEDVDNLYRFEGYKIFQVVSETVSASELEDPEKARLVYQCDLKNGVTEIFNWNSVDDPNSPQELWVPELKVEGIDQGIQHSFKITEDEFSEGTNRSLINHKKYYYMAIAYAHNNYAPYDRTTETGQRYGYLEGRKNIRIYTVIPRPIVHQNVLANYGDGTIVTRIDGQGAGNNFLKVSEETRTAMLADDFDGRITYEAGFSPIKVKIYDPLHAESGEFQLRIVDNNLDDESLDSNAWWEVINLKTEDTIRSDKGLLALNEQLVPEFGFSVELNQVICDAGGYAFNTALDECDCDCSEQNEKNGAIGFEMNYADPDGANWYNAIPDANTPFFISQNQPPVELFNFIKGDFGGAQWRFDPTAELTNLGQGMFYPYKMCDWETNIFERYITPAFTDLFRTNGTANAAMSMDELNNVDIVFTSDKSKWSRCVVVEMANVFYTDGVRAEQVKVAAELDETEFTDSDGVTMKFNEAHGINDGIFHFDVRGVPSVGKDDNDGDGKPDPDNLWITEDDEIIPASEAKFENDDVPLMGMGWFPGYAVDVETGQRLNIFFGENSVYGETIYNLEDTLNLDYFDGKTIGRDMMWNPSSQFIAEGADFETTPLPFFLGGQHFLYVTNEPYDSCQYIYTRLRGSENIATKKKPAIERITWTSMAYLQNGTSFNSYQDGLIPNDLTVSLRVDNPYSVSETKTDNHNGYPTYEFEFKDVAPTEIEGEEVETALDAIRAVPNPYYGYSAYETNQHATTIKITNLPAKCKVTIYTLDGKFIRQYNRDERGISQSGRSNAPFEETQITPALEWDLNNSKSVPVASGIYLIHVDAGELGERVLKWFGVAREFDPAGL